MIGVDTNVLDRYYANDNGCDFADALIGAINREHGFNTATLTAPQYGN